jgi:D-ribulokinase
VIKLLSETRIENADYGIYSHKFGDLWLVGGASNTGGAVLKQFFDEQTLINLSEKIIIETPTNLDYYPLLKPGERFPINDPDLEPKLTPRPQDDVKFLQGLLESIAKIETLGYKLLQELGSTKLTKIYTAGGGAKNQVWGKIRETYLQVPILTSTQTEAAYGSALLSYNSFVK